MNKDIKEKTINIDDTAQAFAEILISLLDNTRKEEVEKEVIIKS